MKGSVSREQGTAVAAQGGRQCFDHRHDGRREHDVFMAQELVALLVLRRPLPRREGLDAVALTRPSRPP